MFSFFLFRLVKKVFNYRPRLQNKTIIFVVFKLISDYISNLKEDGYNLKYSNF